MLASFTKFPKVSSSVSQIYPQCWSPLLLNEIRPSECGKEQKDKKAGVGEIGQKECGGRKRRNGVTVIAVCSISLGNYFKTKWKAVETSEVNL